MLKFCVCFIVILNVVQARVIFASMAGALQSYSQIFALARKVWKVQTLELILGTLKKRFN